MGKETNVGLGATRVEAINIGPGEGVDTRL